MQTNKQQSGAAWEERERRSESASFRREPQSSGFIIGAQSSERVSAANVG